MTEIHDTPRALAAKDWTRRPTTLLLWWVLPFALAEATNFMALTTAQAAFAWGGAMAWMGVGCVLNAIRCHRLHCYIAGPALLIGAAVAALIGSDAVDLGPHALSYTTIVALALAMISFAPEFVWRKYA